MEKRTASRSRVLKPGLVEFDGGAINCMVRNLSNTGAALDLSSELEVPEHFTLVLPAEGRHIPCRIVWRKDRRIGIAFD
jgi:hypothetical protein